MTAPERIWAWDPKSGRGVWVDNPALNGFYGGEYIRHDADALAASPLVQEIVAEAVKAEREACAEVALEYPVPIGCTKSAIEIAAAIRARGEG